MTVRPEPPPLLTENVRADEAVNPHGNRVSIEQRPEGDFIVSLTGLGPMRMMVPMAATDTKVKAEFIQRALDPEHGLGAVSRERAQLRADVARLTEENTRLENDRIELDAAYDRRFSDLKSAQAERDALRQGIAQFRTWLVAEFGNDQLLARASALRMVIDHLDTLLPPGEAAVPGQ